MPVTEEMILECYEAFRKNDRKYIPQGMNANSASMSMLWFDSLFTGKPYHRDGSALQYELILNRIKEDYGIEQLLKAKAVLMEHCEWSLQHHNKPMKKHRAVLNSFDIMPTDDSAELEIVEALLDTPNNPKELKNQILEFKTMFRQSSATQKLKHGLFNKLTENVNIAKRLDSSRITADTIWKFTTCVLLLNTAVTRLATPLPFVLTAIKNYISQRIR